MKYSMKWDLESIFPGGSNSPQLKEKLDAIRGQLDKLTRLVTNWDAEKDSPTFKNLADILLVQEELSKGLSQVFTFIEAIQSADVSDKQAGTISGQIFELNSTFSTLQTILTKKMVAMPDDKWNELIELPAFKAIDFSLNETRTQGKELLSEAEEALINTLSIDGFQGWSDHYDSLVATIEIPFEDSEGQVHLLSAGQAYNKMNTDPDNGVREQLFKKWEETWKNMAPLFSDTLNHLAGFRLADYKAHGVKDFLKRPLEYNRMKQETLDTMWKAVSEQKQPFIDYLNRKAQLLGKDKLSWQDTEAPVIIGDATAKVYPYDDGADFIVENFRKFSEIGRAHV